MCISVKKHVTGQATVQFPLPPSQLHASRCIRDVLSVIISTRTSWSVVLSVHMLYKSFTAVPSCICLSLHVCIISYHQKSFIVCSSINNRCYASHTYGVVYSLAGVCQYVSYLPEIVSQCYVVCGRSLSVHLPNIKKKFASWVFYRSLLKHC